MSQRKAKAQAPKAPAEEPINLDEINGRLQALAAQRNELANQVAVLHGKLSAAQAHIQRLEKSAKPASADAPTA